MFVKDRSRSWKTGLPPHLALLRTTLQRMLSRCFPGESAPVIKERLRFHGTLDLHAIAS